MSRFMSERFSGLVAYVPGEQPRDMSYIKLNTNESPYPPAPAVFEAINAEEIAKLRLYSDPECRELKKTLAAYLDVGTENIFPGNGSDEILSFAFMAFCDENVAVSYPDISYGFYPVFAQLYGIEKNEIPLREDFSIEPEDYYGLGNTIFIANPNAPTGLCLSADSIEKILKANPDNLIVIDEAYVDFGAESCVPLTKKYDNLLVIQTFSKSRSYAGGRLGFAVAAEPIISDLESLRYSTNPFNVDRLSLVAGIAAIESQDYYDKNNEGIIQNREYARVELQNLGFEVLESRANFLFVSPPKLSAAELYSGLRRRGILVRYFDKPRIDSFVRITIGTRNEMEALLAAVREML